MSRSGRMFEIIQILRAARKPRTAQSIAEELEVTKRTIYRDIAALQAMSVPIEGEAGIGYIMRTGYDLPPLMFTVEEVEALFVSIALLRRTGDAQLERAARRASEKIAAILPRPLSQLPPLRVSGWNRIPGALIDVSVLRGYIRDETEIRITYLDLKNKRSTRKILPLALIYYIDFHVVAAWCTLRQDFRHFRADRIERCESTGNYFSECGEKLRREWGRLHEIRQSDASLRIDVGVRGNL